MMTIFHSFIKEKTKTDKTCILVFITFCKKLSTEEYRLMSCYIGNKIDKFQNSRVAKEKVLTHRKIRKSNHKFVSSAMNE